MMRRRFLECGAGVLGAAIASGCATRQGSLASGERFDVAAFHASRRYVNVGSARIAYVERGSGPAAVFFHGFPMNGFQWRGALERLGGHRRCIAPDFIGLGYSEAPAGTDVSPTAQCDMVVGFLDALGVVSVDLICNDSGGTIAQLFAVRHPQRVRSILFTNCEVHTNNPPESFRPVIDLARAGALARVFVQNGLADPNIVRGNMGRAYTDASNLTDELVEAYLRPLVASPTRIEQFHAYTLGLEENVLVAIEPALRSSRVRARIVWGNGDEAFGIEWAHWLHRTLPASLGVRVVPGARLFFPEEFPDLVAEEAVRLWSAAPA